MDKNCSLVRGHFMDWETKLQIVNLTTGNDIVIVERHANGDISAIQGQRIPAPRWRGAKAKRGVGARTHARTLTREDAREKSGHSADYRTLAMDGSAR
jgi:hypothetical protein